MNEAADSISGELTIQMGGKHMTSSQRVEATRQATVIYNVDRPSASARQF